MHIYTRQEDQAIEVRIRLVVGQINTGTGKATSLWSQWLSERFGKDSGGGFEVMTRTGTLFRLLVHLPAGLNVCTRIAFVYQQLAQQISN